MGGKLFFSDFLRNIVYARKKRESFIVLDIGTFGVKGLYVDATDQKDGEKIIASSNRFHVGSDINADGSFNVEGITNTCRAVLNDVRLRIGKRARFSKDVILGVGGGFVFGKTLTQTFIRESPHAEIDESELANIIQKVQQRSYEQIRRDFKRDTGRSELEVHIISAAIQEIKIDGYEVVNPIGFKGKEISCALFNGYIPKSYLRIFAGLVDTLGLSLISFMSQPYAVFSEFLKKNPSIQDFILIDIGGSVTEISLARKGKLEDVRSISLGGSSFTKSIAEKLKIGFWEAENIKRKFSNDEVSGRVAKSIEEMIMRDTELLLHGLEMVLQDMSHVTLLPANIYLYGGGSSIPLLYKILGKKNWRDNLSFFSTPSIESLPLRTAEPFWAVPFSLADTYLSEFTRDDIFVKVLRRSLRLIQS